MAGSGNEEDGLRNRWEVELVRGGLSKLVGGWPQNRWEIEGCPQTGGKSDVEISATHLTSPYYYLKN